MYYYHKNIATDCESEIDSFDLINEQDPEGKNFLIPNFLSKKKDDDELHVGSIPWGRDHYIKCYPRLDRPSDKYVQCSQTLQVIINIQTADYQTIQERWLDVVKKMEVSFKHIISFNHKNTQLSKHKHI